LTAVGQINTNSVLDLGRNALFFKNYMLSIQYFNRVIEAKPYLAQPFFFRAIAKMQLGDYVGTIADGTAAIERNAFLSEAYGVRAVGYIETKEYEKAVTDYMHLLEINPRETNALYNLSLCYLRMKEYDKAEQTLTELTRYTTEGKERIALMKADCAINKGDTLLALKHIDESLTIDSLQENAWAFKGELFLKKKDYKEAEKDLTKAIQINNKEADLFIERAFAYYYQWKLDAALDDYDKAIELSPNHVVAHYNRGLLRQNVGDNNRAIEDFNFILKHQPENEQALINRAILFLQTGNYHGAIEDLSTVIKEHPNFIAGYEYRAEAYKKSGQPAKAALDNAKLMRANMDMKFGGNSWRTKGKPKPARKLNDTIKIENYADLIENNQVEDDLKYSNEYQGRVQDRNIGYAPQPFFLLGYYRRTHEIRPDLTYYKGTEQLNQIYHLPETAVITGWEETLNNDQITRRFASIESLNQKIKRIEDSPQATNLRLKKKKDTLLAAFFLARGIDYGMMQDINSALSDLNSAIHCDSTIMWTYFTRAGLHWKLYQLNEKQQEKENNSIQNTAKITLNKGLILEPSYNKLTQILTDLNIAIKLAPDFFQAYYDRGFILALLGRPNDALESYNQALKLEPNFTEAYYNRGLVFLELKQLKEALFDLSKAGEMGIPSAYNLIKRYTK